MRAGLLRRRGAGRQRVAQCGGLGAQARFLALIEKVPQREQEDAVLHGPAREAVAQLGTFGANQIGLRHVDARGAVECLPRVGFQVYG